MRLLQKILLGILSLFCMGINPDLKQVTICAEARVNNLVTMPIDRTQLLIDEKKNPTQPLLDLLYLLDIPHQKDLPSIVKETQLRWLRKTKERWEIPDLYPEKKAQAMPLLKQLGCTEAFYAQALFYDYALILGGESVRAQERIDFLIAEWQRGVRFKEVVILTGTRFLDPKTEPLAASLKTETEMMLYLFEKTKMPKELKELPLIVIDTPQQLDRSGIIRRPITSDTVRAWLKTHPKPGKCLVISNQPFIGYHDAVLRTELGKIFFTETVGAAADRSLFLPIYLDNLARWIYQIQSIIF